MKKVSKKIICILLCTVMTAGTFVGFPASASKSQLQSDIADLEKQSKELENEISQLKKDKANQQKVLDAIRKKIANTEAQISRCNREIDSINAKISANKAEIDKKNKEIEANKLDFKKRIRAIYMSDSDSSVKILLGAEDFSNFLQLSQLTAAVSSRDKAMIEDIVADIEEINKKNAENEELLKSQISVKETIVAQQKQIEKEEAEAQAVYDDIAGDQAQAEADNKALEAQISEKEDEIQRKYGNTSNSDIINNVTGFAWPVPGSYSISSPFGYRLHPVYGTWKGHKGVDISAGYGKAVVAITDGLIEYATTSCTHNYGKKNYTCGCGGGYGNYLVINHGKVTINGVQSSFTAYYAHLGSVAVTSGTVKKGQVIGYVGSTGTSTGAHLHFGLMKNGGWVDPALYIK